MNNIEKLEMILLAIKRLERNQLTSSIQTAENIDALYTALKSQCESVIEENKLNKETHYVN